MFKSKRILVLSLTAAFLFVGSVSSHAADKSTWDKKHPRRAQVNKRLKNQQNRTDQGLANGKLTTGQAEKIQNQDAQIRTQERQDAAQNGGHITKAEQNQLNHEENGVSREINRDEKQNSAPTPAQ